MTRYPFASLLRELASPVLAFLIVFAFSGCCCDRAPGDSGHGGQSVPVPGAAVGGDGANPLVYGKARFDGNIVHFDVKTVESGTPDTGRMDLRWISHTGGHGSPLPWPVSAQDSYTNDPPTQRWYLYSVPATCDRTEACFHIQVSLYKADGTFLGKVHRSFQPMLDTDWETALGG